MIKISDAGFARCLAYYTNGQKSDKSFAPEELSSIRDLDWSDSGMGEGEPDWFKRANSLSGIEHLTGLTEASFTGNGLSNLGKIGELQNASVLWLGYNDIKDPSPLAGMPKLKELYLDDNPLESIEHLGSLPSLKTLSIQQTRVTVLDHLLTFEKLKVVRVSHADEEAIKVLAELQSKGVQIKTHNKEITRAIEDLLAKSSDAGSDDELVNRLRELDLNQIAQLWATGPNSTDEKGQTPLHLLIEMPHDILGEHATETITSLTKEMLQRGANPLAQRQALYKETPLTLALRKTRNGVHSIDTIRLLADAQSDWTVPYRYGTPLAVALETARSARTDEDKTFFGERVAVLLEHDDALIPGTAFSALCASGDVAQVKRAIELGADVDGYEIEDSPLTAAVWRNQIEVVKTLLAAGADPELGDGTIGAKKPIHNVLSPEMVNLLVEHGADPNGRDGLGSHALSRVFTFHNRNDDLDGTVRALIDAGASFVGTEKAILKYVGDVGIEAATPMVELVESTGVKLHSNFIDGSRNMTWFESEGSRLTTDNKKAVGALKDDFGLKGAKTATHFKQLVKHLTAKRGEFEPGTTKWSGAIKCLRDTRHVEAIEDVRKMVDEALKAHTTEFDAEINALPLVDERRIVAMLVADGPDAVDSNLANALHHLCGSESFNSNPEWAGAAAARAELTVKLVEFGVSPTQVSRSGNLPVGLFFQYGGIGYVSEETAAFESLLGSEPSRVLLDKVIEKLAFSWGDSSTGEAWKSSVVRTLQKHGLQLSDHLGYVAGKLPLEFLEDVDKSKLAPRGVEARSPLCDAVQAHRTEHVNKMIQMGFGANARPEHHDRPLFMTVVPEIASALIKAGCDPSAQNDRGDTAAHQIAGQCGWIADGTDPIGTLRVLLDAGADFSTVNQRNESVVDVLERQLSNSQDNEALKAFVAEF